MKCPAVFLTGTDTAGISLYGREIRAVPVQVESRRLEDRVLSLSGKVVVRVDALSCNYRDRSLILQGTDPQAVHRGPANEPSLTAFGSEFCGTVLAASPDCRLTPGQRVMACSAYPEAAEGAAPGVVTNTASRGVLLVHESQLVAAPSWMTTPQAAAFGLCHQTAAAMIRRSGVGPQSQVLVTAATSSTSMAVRHQLQAIGASCWVVSSKPDTPLLPNERRHPGLEDPAATEIRVSHVIDPFCDLNLAGAVASLEMAGTYITCGMLHQHPLMDGVGSCGSPGELIARIITANLTLMGNCLGTREDLLHALDLARAGSIPLDPSAIHPRDDIDDFLLEAFGSRERSGKVVLSLSPSTTV